MPGKKCNLFLTSGMKCYFCREQRELSDSHIVPKSVLQNLCKWKAGWQEGDKIDERCFIFRTDFGQKVRARECTTKCHALLCSSCEEMFRVVDDCASDFWNYSRLSRNWHKKSWIKYKPKIKKDKSTGRRRNDSRVVNIIEPISEKPNASKDLVEPVDVTMIVLFSVMLRGMYVPVPWHFNKKIKGTFEVFREEVRRGLECPETTKMLRNEGFLYCYLPFESSRLRAEFPFTCALILPKDGEDIRIEAVCAQVPPFFFLMPENGCDKDLLASYCEKIASAVNEKLDNMLNKFSAKYDNFEFQQWYQHLPNEGPVLLFDYLDRTQPLQIQVYFRLVQYTYKARTIVFILCSIIYHHRRVFTSK